MLQPFLPGSFHADPSGTFVRYDAKAIGSGSEGAQTELQDKYNKVRRGLDRVTLHVYIHTIHLGPSSYLLTSVCSPRLYLLLPFPLFASAGHDLETSRDPLLARAEAGHGGEVGSAQCAARHRHTKERQGRSPIGAIRHHEGSPASSFDC